MFIAADDTDSSTWMCTTFLATELVRATAEWDLIGLPRLVRLNPAVPWKTRGNGAICIRVGRGAGEPRLCGRLDGRDLVCYARSAGEPDADEVMARCWPVAMTVNRARLPKRQPIPMATPCLRISSR